MGSVTPKRTCLKYCWTVNHPREAKMPTTIERATSVRSIFERKNFFFSLMISLAMNVFTARNKNMISAVITKSAMRDWSETINMVLYPNASNHQNEERSVASEEKRIRAMMTQANQENDRCFWTAFCFIGKQNKRNYLILVVLERHKLISI